MRSLEQIAVGQVGDIADNLPARWGSLLLADLDHYTLHLHPRAETYMVQHLCIMLIRRAAAVYSAYSATLLAPQCDEKVFVLAEQMIEGHQAFRKLDDFETKVQILVHEALLDAAAQNQAAVN